MLKAGADSTGALTLGARPQAPKCLAVQGFRVYKFRAENTTCSNILPFAWIPRFCRIGYRMLNMVS